MANLLVEIVCCSVADARATERAGAHRVELCSALELGGLTPSSGLLESIKSACSLPVMAMVRPRPGGFRYDADELAVMERDARLLLSYGADGIVFGILSPDGTINADACRRILDVAEGKPCVFHRAFDGTPNLPDALETLFELGFARILTSGGAETALEGAEMLDALQRQSCGRIEILPGGGIRAENALQLLRRTGSGQIHCAPLRPASDPTAARNAIGLNYGGYRQIDEAAVAAIIAAVTAAS